MEHLEETELDILAEDRSLERTEVDLEAIVQFKEAHDDFWKERTQLVTLSRNGAGFRVSRPCAVGRLVSMVMQMPTQFRVYDHDAERYVVSGVVQYCNESVAQVETTYEVGVAFIGKQLPASYRDDPQQSYRISGMGADGLWNVKEFDFNYRKRKHQRFWIALPTVITVLKSEERIATRDESMTVNVSEGGASVVTSLQASIGDRVKFACRHIDFYAVGTVRGFTNTDVRGSCVHIEFPPDQRFPLEKVLPCKKKETAKELSPLSYDGQVVRYEGVRIQY
jgi:hypothetical protein